MKHLDDGTLQAFLDDELQPRERTAAAEHLLECPRCRTAKAELARAHSTFSEAVALLDVDPVGTAPSRAERGFRPGGGAFVKAAGLILFLSAAASAAVPGSPVREWIEKTVRSEPTAEATETLDVEAVVPAPNAAPAGVSLPARGPVEVALSGLQGTTIRLVETDGRNVTVSMLGARTDPTFRTAAGRIEVGSGVGGELTVEMPRSLTSGRLVVDGRLYAEYAAGEVRVHVPADVVEEGVHVWR